MRGIVIIVGGLLLLGLFVFVARWLGGPTAGSTVLAAKVLLPIWPALAPINMWIGVGPRRVFDFRGAPDLPGNLRASRAGCGIRLVKFS